MIVTRVLIQTSQVIFLNFMITSKWPFLYQKTHKSVWTNLGKHSLFVWLCVCSVKTGTRRVIRVEELSSAVRLERCTTEDNSSRRIMRLLPVFTLHTNNQTNNECLSKFVQTDNASSSIKTANKLASQRSMSLAHLDDGVI